MPAGSMYETIGEENAIKTLVTAVKCGVNFIDTAPWYNRSEDVIGKALKHIPRKAYYIATKVGRYSPDREFMFDFSKERVLQVFERSLRILGVDYVDLLMVHDLEYAENIDQVIYETLPALRSLVEQGKVRFIGVTGYPLHLLKEVISKSPVKVDAVLSYSRNTLVDDELKNYIPYFQEKNMGILNAAAVSQGLLTPAGPQHWHAASLEIKEAAREASQYCQKRGVNIAKLAVYYSLQTEGIHCHLMGSTSDEILQLNLKTVTSSPSADDLKMIKEVRERFFLPLKQKHWEGPEPEHHRRMLKMIRGEIPKTADFERVVV